MAMKQAAGGLPSGNHGLFHRFGIEAVTIESVHKFTKRTRRREFDLFTAGKLMEGIFRSLNNLLERFHQSFFFYLLPSSSRYVSIGMYMPAFGFLAGSLLIRALGLWYECITEINAEDSSEHIQVLSKNPQVGRLIQGWILTHLMGIVLVMLPRSAVLMGAKLDLASDDSVALFILAYSVFVSVLILNNQDSFGTSWRLGKDWQNIGGNLQNVHLFL